MARRFLPITSAAMQAALRTVAERHGYIATRGPLAGQGNPSELIQALDCGELATVLLDPDDRWKAIRALEASSDDILVSIGQQLRIAAERESEE